MSRTGLTVPMETIERYLADDNTRRGRIVSGVLLLWIVGSLIIDLVHFVPRGTSYYLYLDLIILLPIVSFGFLIWRRPGSARRIRLTVFLFSVAFLVWTAVLTTFQETPYTLFIAAFFVSASLLLRPSESIIVYSSSFAAYVFAVTLHQGSPLAQGTALFLEVLAMTATAALVSILLYRQRVKTLEAEEQLRHQNRRQEEEIAVRTEDLKRRLTEREVLLREIHHRVKNNLQILASILRLSEEYRNGKDAVAFLRGAEQRIVSMAMVHQQLDDAENLERVDLENYLSALTDYVIASFQDSSEITFMRNLESISVSIDMAVNLGLLITEVLSNALQHAFDQEQSDRQVSLAVQSRDSRLVFMVGDNGKGICPENDEDKPREGLGLVLIESLSTQLHGSFTYDCSSGTTFRFEVALAEG